VLERSSASSNPWLRPAPTGGGLAARRQSGLAPPASRHDRQPPTGTSRPAPT